MEPTNKTLNQPHRRFGRSSPLKDQKRRCHGRLFFRSSTTGRLFGALGSDHGRGFDMARLVVVFGPHFFQLKKRGPMFCNKFSIPAFLVMNDEGSPGVYIYIILYYLGNLWQRNRTSPTKGSLVRKFGEKSRLMKECESS